MSSSLREYSCDSSLSIINLHLRSIVRCCIISSCSSFKISINFFLLVYPFATEYKIVFLIGILNAFSVNPFCLFFKFVNAFCFNLSSILFQFFYCFWQNRLNLNYFGWDYQEQYLYCTIVVTWYIVFIMKNMHMSNLLMF